LAKQKEVHGGSRRTYEWPRPAVTVDIAIFTVLESDGGAELQVLLVERDLAPFAGAWALPGGFVHENEDLSAAAARELLEETGVREGYLEQVGAVGTPGRDPRGHTVTVLYAALLPPDKHVLRATGDARSAQWHALTKLPELAFDHSALLEAALSHVRRSLGRNGACFALLPDHFTLTELQTVCEVVLGRPLDRRNFRRKLEEGAFLSEVKGEMRTGRHRPAQVYQLIRKRFEAHAQREGAIPF
jgi:8-oxo-dGTP diphosphatase